MGAAERRIPHYRLLHPLGAGGMGEVFAAVDETLKRRVALKAIHDEYRVTADAKARFLREAQILSQLDHPHICRVYDYITDHDRDWLVLELIEGKSLRTAIQAGLDHYEAMRIARQVAAVLVATHAAGVVHRDLKPGNVMVNAAGDAKVLDFGLARSITRSHQQPPRPAPVPAGPDEPTLAPHDTEARRDPEATTSGAAGAVTGWSALPTVEPDGFQTHTGGISGTVAYMSPEQATGEAPAAASDMFSFGLMLQEMFTGQRAYARNLHPVSLLEHVRRGQTLPAAGLDADLAKLIGRLTSVAPTQRPTAVETVERLQWIAAKPARRLRRLMVAALLALAVVGAARYTWDLARERRVAVAAREDADRRRGQAETLIGFMLGNLRPKLEQVGRLDLLEDVGREAMAYFSAVPAAQMSGEELFRRSQAIYQIGQVRQAEGRLPQAVEAYRESLSLAQQVAERDPENSEWQLGVAMAHFYLGDALRVQADPAGAMRELSAYRDIARRLVERDPSNEKWRLELAYGHGNVAAILEAESDLVGARRELELAQGIKEELARRTPDDVERQQAVATGHNRLGTVIDKLGDTDGAITHYLADLEIRRALVARDPRNYAIRRSLFVAIDAVARAHEERGDLAGAVRYYRESRDQAAVLATADARNLDWQRDFAIGEARLADALRLTGDRSESPGLYAHALAILRPIAGAARTQAARQRDLASIELGTGRLALDRGDMAAAAIHAGAVQQLTAPLIAKGTDRVAARLAAEGLLLAADVAARRGDRAAARRWRESALALLPDTAQVIEKRATALRARALLALERIDEARPIVEGLLKLGYRHPSLVTQWQELM